MRDDWLRWRNPIVLGPLVGWGVGIVWWITLMIAFGPTHVVTERPEETITVCDRVLYAPIVAIPWAVVGFIVGGLTALVKSWAVPLCAALGTMAGSVYVLATEPFDGWLAMTMPVACLGGTLLGMLIGGAWGAFGRSD